MLGFEENPLLAKPENESNGEPAENLDDDADDNDDDIPNPNDDFEQGEESNDDNQNSRKVVYDDLAGQSDVEVIAARMCF